MTSTFGKLVLLVYRLPQLVLAAILTAGSMEAQSIGAPDRPPQHAPLFFTVTNARSVAVDANTVTSLRRIIAIDLDNRPLTDALAAISGAAHLPIFYSDSDVPADRHVTLAASKITV